MRVCELPYLTPSLNSINYSAPLDIIDLYHNNLNSSVIHSWLFNFNNSVTEITLSGNNLHGPLPDGFANIVSLVHLDLSDNNLEGQMLEFLKNFSRRVSRTLEYLNLDGNLMRGPLPDTIVEFQSLKELRLQWNELNGSIPKAFGELPNLTVLDLSGNNLEGVISQSHLRNLLHLQMLDLSFNSGLALRFRLDWIPHFQLQVLRLRNCKLGPYFPKWIQTQKNIYEIDLSTTGISDEIPSWFWDQISGVKELDLSNNRMDNTLPDLYTKVSDLVMLNLSLNHFKGPIPRLPNTIEMVDLSKNKLSGEITFLCNSPLDYIFYLDLSDNQLSGELSDCWAHLENLEFLNLNNNNLSGKIPTSMGSLPLLKTLLLRKNSFTKELPRSWQYSESLNFIELGENKLSGAIPEWLGRNLSQLIVLDLSWNNFSGSVPQNICNLSLIQILDLSGNKISGRIPKCISNFSAMIQEWSAMQNLSIGLVFSSLHNSIIHMFSFEAFLTWKGREAKYKSTLPFVKGIDLSSNRLTGDIPLEVSSLVGLVGLNLSRNHLTGILPPEIGKLKSLDFLDLSRNRIFGEIPSSLSQISLLGMLDLSYNNLTGRIPTGTQLQSFDASSYANNSGLCGEPLTRVCPEDELPQDPNLEGGAEEHEDKFITTGFYLSTALGFIIGFWGICGSLILNRSLRYAFFEFINSMQDWLYVIIALKLSRCCRGGFMNK